MAIRKNLALRRAKSISLQVFADMLESGEELESRDKDARSEATI